MTMKIFSALVLLPAFLLSACSTHPRSVTFQSVPSGAIVSVEGQSCTTPCQMSLSADGHIAAFAHPTNGEQKMVAVEPRMSAKNEATYMAAKGTSTTLIILSIPLLVFGMFGVGGYIDIDDVEVTDNADESDGCPFREDVCLASLASLVAGGILFGVGKTVGEVLSPDAPETEVYALFEEKVIIPPVPAAAATIDDMVKTGNPLFLPQAQPIKPSASDGKKSVVDPVTGAGVLR